MRTPTRLAAGLAASAALLLAACGGSDESDPALAFVTSRDGPYSIYLMDEDGGGEHSMTDRDAGQPSSPAELFYETEPAWSPDGSRIAFASKRNGSYDVFVANVDGTGTRRLTSTREDDSHPTWSPDGRRIAFQRGSTPDIYIMDADGGNVRRVGRDPAGESQPAWSPDGRWIAYQRREPGSPSAELWLARPDGSGRRQLTRFNARTYEPAWSPDGKRLAFTSTARGTNFDIFTIGVDGKSLRRVIDSGEDEFEPTWSPDGATIAFNRDGAIVATELGNGEVRTLTSGDTNDSSPAWRPTRTPR